MTCTQYFGSFCAVTGYSYARNSGRRTSFLFALALTVAIMATPWTIRNYCTFNRFYFVRSNFWLEVAVSNHDSASTTFEENYRTRVFQPRHPLNDERQFILYRQLGEAKYMDLQRQIALDWILHHPGKTAMLGLRRLWRSLVFKYENNILLSTALGGIGLCGLIGFGLRLFCRGLSAPIVCFALTVGAFITVHLLVQVALRYRYPVHVLLLIPCGYCVLWGFNRLRTGLGRRGFGSLVYERFLL